MEKSSLKAPLRTTYFPSHGMSKKLEGRISQRKEEEQIPYVKSIKMSSISIVQLETDSEWESQDETETYEPDLALGSLLMYLDGG